VDMKVVPDAVGVCHPKILSDPWHLGRNSTVKKHACTELVKGPQQTIERAPGAGFKTKQQLSSTTKEKESVILRQDTTAWGTFLVNVARRNRFTLASEESRKDYQHEGPTVSSCSVSSEEPRAVNGGAPLSSLDVLFPLSEKRGKNRGGREGVLILARGGTRGVRRQDIKKKP